jgi:phosphoglucosamine mutase
VQCRGSGQSLVDTTVAGCCECGADVIDLGMAATPMVVRSIRRLNADAVVVVLFCLQGSMK